MSRSASPPSRTASNGDRPNSPNWLHYRRIGPTPSRLRLAARRVARRETTRAAQSHAHAPSRSWCPARSRSTPTPNRACAQRCGPSPHRIRRRCCRCGIGSRPRCGSCGEDEQLAQGLLDRRSELKGRLTAYQAKAARLGLGEDPDLLACQPDRCRTAVATAVRPSCGDPRDRGLPAVDCREAGEDQMRCAEPGCGGTVVDGYCDVCGTAPAPAATAKAGHERRPPSTPTARPLRQCERLAPGRRRSASARGRLGAGIVEIPRIPKGDPAAAILTDPQVPEGSRFCGNPECNKPVGRARGRTARVAPRASAPSAAPDTRLFPSFLAAISSADSTKCRAALRMAASAGSTWRSTATCTTAGWCSRAC